MRYVIIRDDDTSALTPPECLEELYRPFLKAGFPVNLATIPAVSKAARNSEGEPEGFLLGKPGEGSVAIGDAPPLVRYLRENPGFRIVQHGLYHGYREFDRVSAGEAAWKLEEGRALLAKAGLGEPTTFVAPHDKFSREGYIEAARRFRVISTGWFELRRLPRGWWPLYLIKKARGAAHWKVGNSALLSHPGCILSYHRKPGEILPRIVAEVGSRKVTVLVTHWWEDYRNGGKDAEFVHVLHEVANWLVQQQGEVRVISFEDVGGGSVGLN